MAILPAMSLRIGHRGDRWIELGAWHAVVGEALRFYDAMGAMLFLRERIQPNDIRTLRALLTAESALTRRLDDAAVLRLVSHRLHARKLKAVAWYERSYGFVERPVVWQLPRAELPAAPLREAAPDLADLYLSAPAAGPLMPGDWNAEAQAHTLREAALDGTPLCEICQRSPRS